MQEMPFQRPKIKKNFGGECPRTALKISSLLPKVTKFLDPPLTHWGLEAVDRMGQRKRLDCFCYYYYWLLSFSLSGYRYRCYVIVIVGVKQVHWN